MNIDELKSRYKSDVPKYSKKQRQSIVDDAVEILGTEKMLVLCIEEISELIDVISSNMSSKVNYLHTVEEMADVQFSLMYMKNVCNIDDNDIKKPNKKKKPGKGKIFPIISSLCNGQMALSKYMRGKKDGYERVVEAYNEICEDIIILEKFFKIKEKDVEKVLNIKLQRTEERILYNTLD